MTTGFVFNPFTGNFDVVTTSIDASTDITGILPIANGGTNTAGPFTAGSVIFSDGTSFAEDNANFYWDDAGNTLQLGGILGTVPFALTVQRDDTDTNGGFAGSIFAVHNSFNTTNNNGLNSTLNVTENVRVDAGVSAGASAALFFVAQRADPLDEGSLGILAGMYGSAKQNNTNATANTDLLVGVLAEVQVGSGTATTVADFYSFPSNITGGTITNMHGIYINPPSAGFKSSWISGRILAGGSSYSAPTVELDVQGDARVRNLGVGIVHSDASGNLSSSDVDIATEVTGVLPEANGGTNQSTYTTGDILYASASNTLSKLAIGSDGDYLTITSGVPDWTTITPGAGITARAATNAGQTISAGNTDIIDFEDVTYDSNSNITTGASWKYTVGTGESGVYNVNVKLRTNAASGTGASIATAFLYLNGSVYSEIACWADSTTLNPVVVMQGSDSITLADADYIDIRFLCNDFSLTLASSDAANHVSIQKVG